MVTLVTYPVKVVAHQWVVVVVAQQPVGVSLESRLQPTASAIVQLLVGGGSPPASGFLGKAFQPVLSFTRRSSVVAFSAVRGLAFAGARVQ